MTVKEEVLKALEENRGCYFSGEALAQRLDKSRAAIWKAVNQLKSEGYMIEAVPNKGYSLNESTDLISWEGINNYLKEEYKDIKIEVYKEIQSTNEEAKKEAVNGKPHGTVIISEGQTCGRGRRGRQFYSPKGTGIYMSIILRPDLEVNEATLITTAASVAISRAIEKVTKLETGIKWVNDIYIKEKKIAGILTEAVTDFETGKVEWIILGVGINFSTKAEDYPEELKDIAGSIFDKKQNTITRNELVAEVLNEVFDIEKEFESRSFLEEYRRRSIVLGKQILVLQPNKTFEAKAVDIDDMGGLIIEDEEGLRSTLKSGEISIRVNNVIH